METEDGPFGFVEAGTRIHKTSTIRQRGLGSWVESCPWGVEAGGSEETPLWTCLPSNKSGMAHSHAELWPVQRAPACWTTSLRLWLEVKMKQPPIAWSRRLWFGPLATGWTTSPGACWGTTRPKRIHWRATAETCWRSRSVIYAECSSTSACRSSILLEPARDGWEKPNQPLESSRLWRRGFLVEMLRVAAWWKSQAVLSVVFLLRWRCPRPWRRSTMRRPNQLSKSVPPEMHFPRMTLSLWSWSEALVMTTSIPPTPSAKCGVIRSKLALVLMLNMMSTSMTLLESTEKRWSKVQAPTMMTATKALEMRAKKRSSVTARGVMAWWRENQLWKGTSCRTSVVACCIFVVKIQRTICNQWRWSSWKRVSWAAQWVGVRMAFVQQMFQGQPTPRELGGSRERWQAPAAEGGLIDRVKWSLRSRHFQLSAFACQIEFRCHEGAWGVHEVH